MNKQEFYQECCLRAMTVFLSDADLKDKTPEEVADIVTSFAGALADAVFPEREFSVSARGFEDRSDESSTSLLSACLTHFSFDREHYLPVRIANVLCGHGITTLRKLMDADPDELRQIRGLGEHSLKQIREFLDSFYTSV